MEEGEARSMTDQSVTTIHMIDTSQNVFIHQSVLLIQGTDMTQK